MSNKDHRTLNTWRGKLSGSSRTIECAFMRLNGRDHEPNIFTGPGRIEIKNEQHIQFFMYATPSDRHAAFRKLQTARENPDNALEQFRLVATDYNGIEWHGGYTTVEFFSGLESGWPLTGQLDSLMTDVEGNEVAKTSSVELLLIPPVDLPTSEWMETTTRIASEEISG